MKVDVNGTLIETYLLDELVYSMSKDGLTLAESADKVKELMYSGDVIDALFEHGLMVVEEVSDDNAS